MAAPSRLMTAEEVFAYNVNRYPSLYASLNEKSTRIAVYDQLFNVIGNGYRDMDDLQRHFTWTPAHQSVVSGVPQKYMGQEPIYEGFLKATQTRSGHVQPDYESRMQGFYTEAEKALYPDVQQWNLHEKGEGIGFYPNFSADYSLLHKIDRNALDVSWLEAGLYFYREAKAYFASPEAEYYSDAWPSDVERQKEKVDRFDRDRDPNKQAETWAMLSTNYGVPYMGDTPAFLSTYWDKEKARIVKFVDSTISTLELELRRRIEPNGLGL